MSNQHDCCRHFTTHALYIFEEKNVCENMTAWTLYTYNLRLHTTSNRFVFFTNIQICEYETIWKIDSHVPKFNISPSERICCCLQFIRSLAFISIIIISLSLSLSLSLSIY